MKTVKVVLCLLMVTVSSAFAQVKGEMPFTSSSPNANALLRKAWAAMADANMEEGNKYVQQVLQEDPACAMAYLSDPTIKEEERDANIRRAEGLKLSEDEKLFLEGLKASGDKKPARQYFDPLLKKYPRDHHLHLTVMFIVHPQEPAIDIGESIIKRNPKFAPAYNLLGYAYMEKDEMAKAESNFDKYITLRPDLANAYDSKADFLVRAGKAEEGIALYEKAASMGMAASAERAEDARGRLKFPELADDDKSNIRSILSASIAAYAKGDPDALLKDYSEHAIKIWGHQTATVGLAGVRHRVSNFLNNANYKKFEGPISFVDGVGPIAFASGTLVTVSDLPGAFSEPNHQENVLYLLRKKPNGDWKILADHFYAVDAGEQQLSEADRQSIERLLDNWNKSLPPGKAIEDQQIKDFASSYSDQAIEIFGDHTSNIGLPNLRARWSLFKGSIMDRNSLGTPNIEGHGRRAVAWGIGKQSFYPKGSNELYKSQFPWAMFLTKEGNDWKILVIHFGA